ncbi:hypothetical protein PF008_g17393 [Phytophthora fragariae]|uniref:Uncharacterized protein n=1 Tax=Phytophthora fragariae TaxID=53985 RepID=A0A6G0R8C9_9STRA|nr:hypothetical protein PF008_g17393 [Phytophthora fragariae]
MRMRTNDEGGRSLTVTAAPEQAYVGGERMTAPRRVDDQVRGRVRVVTASELPTNDDETTDDDGTKEESPDVDNDEDEMNERGRTTCCASWSADNMMNEVMQLMRTEAASKDDDRAARYVATMRPAMAAVRFVRAE